MVGRVCVAGAALVAAAGFPLVAGSQIKEKIEVIDLSKHSTASERNTALRDMCAQWVLTPDDVVTFFRNAHRISGEEWHAKYDVLPCQYSGTLVRGGQWQEFEINAGSFGSLDEQWYGCIRECEALFQVFGAYGDDDD